MEKVKKAPQMQRVRKIHQASVMEFKLEQLLIGDTLNDPDIEKYTGLPPLLLRRYLRSQLPITTSLCKLGREWFLSYNKEYKNLKEKFNFRNLIVAGKRKKGTPLPNKEEAIQIKTKLRNNIPLTDIISGTLDIETVVAIKQNRICAKI